MFDKKKLVRDFNRAASTYDSFARLQKNVSESLYKKARQIFFNDEVKILDGGAGTGYLEVFANNDQLPWQIVAMDIAPEMCRKIKEKKLAFNEVVCGDLESIPLIDEYFDGVISSLAMQWIGNIPAALEEIRRVTRDYGHIVISTFGDKTLMELKKVMRKVDKEDNVNPFTPEKVFYKHIIKAGFSDIAITSESIKRTYPSVRELLKEIKGVGGTYKGERSSPRSKGYFEKLKSAYSADYPSKDGGIVATWEVLYVTARK